MQFPGVRLGITPGHHDARRGLFTQKLPHQLATGTVAPIPYALFMKAEDRVPITLRCFGCLVEREILIPRERGMVPGKYLWECIECQGRRIGWSGNELLEGEGK